jgi:hypothetical protein
MEVQLDFAINHSTDTFHQAVRLIILLPDSPDLVQLHAGHYLKCRLIDCLITGIQIGHDEVACGPIS